MGDQSETDLDSTLHSGTNLEDAGDLSQPGEAPQASSTSQPQPSGMAQTNGLMQKFQEMSRGLQITIVAAIIGLLSSFLPWAQASFSGGGVSVSQSANGWMSWGYLAILAFIVAGVVAALPLWDLSVRRYVSALPPMLDDAMLLIAVGAIALIAILLFILSVPSTSLPLGYSGSGISTGPAFGAFLALLCAAAIIVGGYLMRQQAAPQTS